MSDQAQWDETLAGLPGAHILQTEEWGRVKQQTGWKALPQVWRDREGKPEALALALRRAVSVRGLSAGLRILYVPRGPVLQWNDPGLRSRVLDDLQSLARRQGAIFLKIDPAVILGTGVPGTPEAVPDDVGEAVQAELKRRGWRYSEEQIQFRNTVWVDLRRSEDELLARMKQKTRYNIRLAEKKGVTVRLGSAADLPELYRMYAETSVRDGFVIRSQDYYETVWRTFMEAGMAQPLIAEVEGQPVGALIVFTFARTAWYLYGMSRTAQREKMPNHLLQWEAMRYARAKGCETYDMWGAPEVFDESDGMWGVYRFKEGFGGTLVRTLGAWDYPANPIFYHLYTRVLPRLLDVMRRRGKARTRQEISL